MSYDDEDVGKVINDMREFVSKKGGEPSSFDFLAELRTMQATLAFDEKIRLFIAVSALCGDKLNKDELQKWKEHVEEVLTKGKEGALAGPDVLWVFDAYLKANPDTAK